MMKFWSRVCFLVLAVSSLSRGQNDVTGGPYEMQETPPPFSADETQNETLLMLPVPHPQNQTSMNTTDLPPTVFTTQEEINDFDADNVTTTEEGNTTAQTAAPVSVPGSGKEGVKDDATTVPTTTDSASSKPVTEDKQNSFWGYVILVLIIFVIIILCAILYILRRVSRTYSFDLQRPSPVNRLNEPIGTFEPVYLDDLDRPAPKENMTTDDLSPPPVGNGTALPSEENCSNGENAPQEQPGANGSPTSNTSTSLGDDPTDKPPSPLGSTSLFFDIIGEEQQNGNNNNPSVCYSDPFVEINLDEPAWCNELLTSTEAPSSVLPFSPFSFSSSSSS